MKNWVYQNYLQAANRIDYFKNQAKLGLSEREVVQRLADDYLVAKKNNNEMKIDSCFAGLMIKSWRAVTNMNRKCDRITYCSYEDYTSELADSIKYVLDHHVWTDPTRDTNAQACINMIISSRCEKALLKKSNRQKDLANFNTISLDKSINAESDDRETTIGDTIASDETNPARVLGADSIIWDFIKAKKYAEAVVTDIVCHTDSTRTYTDEDNNADYVMHSSRKCMTTLTSLDPDYVDYFADRYHTNPVEIEQVVANLHNASKVQARKIYSRTLDEIKELHSTGKIDLRTLKSF